MAAHHSTSHHDAEENKDEKMSQGRAEKLYKGHVFLPDLGTIF